MSPLTVLLVSWLTGQQADPATQPPSDPEALVRTVDTRRYSWCTGDLMGFSNILMQCTVGVDGRLGQCTNQTDDPRILRQHRKFECMASAISVTRANGSPATGRTVRIRLNGGNVFSLD